MKVAVSLAKNILALLRITVAASVIDAGIQKKLHDSGTTTLVIPNEEMKKLFKFIKILISYWKELLKQLKMIQKRQKGEF